MDKNIFKPIIWDNNNKGFSVVEVIIVTVVLILLATIIFSVFSPSVPKKGASVSYTSIALNGSFTTIPTTITTKSMVVKFTLTDATGAPVKDRLVTFKLTNMTDSKFTNRKKGRKVKTNKQGIAITAIRAKKNKTGDGTITASIIYKKAAGKWGQATEESTVFEIDGTN